MNQTHAAAVLALFAIAPGGAIAQQFNQLNQGLDVETVIETELGKSVVYAAKFVCGLPPGELGNFVGPVAPGFYFTSINIYNPNGSSVDLAVRVLEVSRAGGGNPGHRTATGAETIGGNAAIKIDCFDVAQFFGQTTFTNSEGFVAITIDKKMPINVIGVYTASVEQSPT